MLFNKGKKEFILSLYLKFYPEKISNLLGYKIEEFELEKFFDGRKVDMYTESGDRTIFIELQLTMSDNTHLRQILDIVLNSSSNRKTTIVWIANGFKDDLLNEVENKIIRLKRNIEFIGIELDENIIGTLDKLDNLNELDVISNLAILEGNHYLNIIRRFYRKLNKESDSVHLLLEKSKPQNELLLRILKEMKEQIGYFPNVHRDKKFNGNMISLGAGRNDMNFVIGYSRDNQIFVEMRFSENNKDIFESVLRERVKLDKKFDYQIDWDLENYKITSSCKFEGNKDRIIKQQVRVLDKMIQYFGRALVGQDEHKKTKLRDL